jgi:hypothetical protein
MRNLSVALWLALVGAVLQTASVFTDYYVYKDVRKSAWFGVAQTSEMILWSALLTLALIGLTAASRSPVSGKTTGRIIGVVGSLTALQVFYRMNAPPFDAEVPQHVSIVGTSCLYYCWPSQAVTAEVLSGMWMALTGCIMVAAGGAFHLLWSKAQHAPARPWIAAEQSGATPWLGLAGLGAVGQFVFGYTFFTFYRTVRANGVATSWSGWLPAPHTAWLVFMITVIVVGLVWLAVRERAPLNPKNLGMAIATLGVLSAGRMAYRIYQPPFRMDAEIGPAAYLALAAAVLIVVAGCMHAGVLPGKRQSP